MDEVTYGQIRGEVLGRPGQRASRIVDGLSGRFDPADVSFVLADMLAHGHVVMSADLRRTVTPAGVA